MTLLTIPIIPAMLIVAITLAIPLTKYDDAEVVREDGYTSYV